MDSDLIIPLLSRWAHVGSAIVLVGGAAFFRLAVLPSLEGDNTELVGRIRNRWKKVVHSGILVFLLSGFYNYLFVTIPQHKGDKLYHPLMGVKILLAFFVFFLASVLVGSKPSSQKFRADAKKWTGIMLACAAVIVGISGFLKVRGIPEKPAADVTVENIVAE